MKVFIIHAHTANRGDEAAIKAMVDELLLAEPNTEIVISINGRTFYPAMDPRVEQIGRFPTLHSIPAKIEYPIFIKTCGKIRFTESGKKFYHFVQSADLIIHAPGGPSIGDIYAEAEKQYLDRLNLIRRKGKKYMFYAPSMGPFNDKSRESIRKDILMGASKVILRDPISYKYVEDFCPECHPVLALDSAFQHDVDEIVNQEKLRSYKALDRFLSKHEKNIGVTITDLKWHPKHGKTGVSEVIKAEFQKFIGYLDSRGYGIIFIPQLYGTGNDSGLMEEFSGDTNRFVMDADNDEYDTYFQQYIIGKLTAVVGMRYHSNIFSAKMGIPFVSVSYEQKMAGFMESAGLTNYCIDIKDLSVEMLINKFELMMKNYCQFKALLEGMHNDWKQRAYISTQAVLDILTEKQS